MPFDLHKNLAIALVATAPVPPDSGSTFTVPAGQGSRFSAPPFNVTIWKASEYPNPANAEVGRCTAVAGDVLTVLRAQEGTTARAVQVGDLIAQSVTDLYLQSIESGENFPHILTNGNIVAQGIVAAPSMLASTSMGAPLGDFGTLHLGNAATVVNLLADPGSPEGVVALPVGSLFLREDGGPASTLYVKESGGATATGWVALASAGAAPSLHAITHTPGNTDTIPNVAWTNVSNTFTEPQTIIGSLDMRGTSPTSIMPLLTAIQATTGGRYLWLANSVGQFLCGVNNAAGTENSDNVPNSGYISTAASGLSLMSTGSLRYYTGGAGGVLRGTMHPSGGFSWGSAVDPGATNVSVTGTLTAAGLGSTPLNATNLTTGTVPDARLSVNVLKFTGGYPGGATTFLRADGTFAAPGGGAPTAHATTHNTGGSDPLTALSGGIITTGTVADARLTVNVLKFTGGYPGGTATFLRADGTFAAPPGGGGVALHASTHTPGNTDPIPNVAWTNVANTFSANQTITQNLTVDGLILSGSGLQFTTSFATISANTADGADNRRLDISSGGTALASRGAYLTLNGNESAGAQGRLNIEAGDASAGDINFLTGSTARGRMHRSGGFSWGSTTDPGAGNLSVGGLVLTTNGSVRRDTATGSNTGYAQLTGAGIAGATYGGTINVYGNEYVPSPGGIDFYGGNTGGKLQFFTNAILRGTMHPSGGFSWGSTVDPGAGNLSVAGSLKVGAGILNTTGAITQPTNDGADHGLLQLAGGGSGGDSRGATINLFGNEWGGAASGTLALFGGNAAGGGNIDLYTGPSVLRGRIHLSGGFSWGGTADGGPGTIFLGASAALGTAYLWFRADGSINQGTAGTAAANLNVFYNANGIIGSIISNVTATAYNTTSDARLKDDLGLPLDTRVLPALLVHDFRWKSSGTVSRGLFAQEAIDILPEAVTRGCDGPIVDEPWQMDYSKVVPDLIVGWQQHERIIDALRAELVTLKAQLARLFSQGTDHAHDPT